MTVRKTKLQSDKQACVHADLHTVVVVCVRAFIYTCVCVCVCVCECLHKYIYICVWMNLAREGGRKKTKKVRKRVESEREHKHIIWLTLLGKDWDTRIRREKMHTQIRKNSMQNKIGISAGEALPISGFRWGNTQRSPLFITRRWCRRTRIYELTANEYSTHITQ